MGTPIDGKPHTSPLVGDEKVPLSPDGYATTQEIADLSPGGGGSFPDFTVNSGPVINADATYALAATQQPLTPPSGIIQPLPSLIGRTFPGTFEVKAIATTPSSGLTQGICVGFDQNVYVVDAKNLGVWQLDANGTVLNFFPLSGSTLNGPYDICSGPDQNLYITDFNLPGVWQLTLAGVATSFILSGANPEDICSAADGFVYMSDDNSQVWKIDPADPGSATTIPIGSGTGPVGIFAGPDGKVWVVDGGGGIYTVASDATVVELLAPPSGAIGMDGGCSGPDGNGWMLNPSGHEVWRLTPQGVLTRFSFSSDTMGHICVGAGGDLWAVGSLGVTAQLWKITTTGVVTAFPITGISAAVWLCSGPDGALWITDLATDVIVFPFTVQAGGLNLTTGPLTTAGPIGIIATVPADGDISNGQLWVGFDDTPGACLTLLKAKDSTGTVVSASIPLT